MTVNIENGTMRKLLNVIGDIRQSKKPKTLRDGDSE